MKNRIFSLRFLAMVFASGLLCFGLGYGLGGKGGDGAHMGNAVGEAKASPDDSLDPAVYVCPMNCVRPMEKPGKCPVCGMARVGVPAQEYGEGEDGPRIVLSERSLDVSGIQVAPVERKSVSREIRLFGKIEYDLVERQQVAAFAPGVIERVYVERPGEVVKARDPLFDIHCSDLFYLEQELFEILKQFPEIYRDSRPVRDPITGRLVRAPIKPLALKVSKKGEKNEEEENTAREKMEQLRRKMVLLGLSIEDIDSVVSKGGPSGIFTVTAPIFGIVMEQLAFKGRFVSTGDNLFTIANPRKLWAKFDAYASDFSWIKMGQEAEFETDALPGEKFKGRVLFLNPVFNEQRRTFEVGVLYMDTAFRLRPNMLVRGMIHAKMTEGGVSATDIDEIFGPPLVIPDTAPLITGKRAIVYVEVPGTAGAFKLREVVLGHRAKGYYVVKQGLEPGEKVVTHGNFKIDSAVQILSKGSMMEPKSR